MSGDWGMGDGTSRAILLIPTHPPIPVFLYSRSPCPQRSAAAMLPPSTVVTSPVVLSATA